MWEIVEEEAVDIPTEKSSSQAAAHLGCARGNILRRTGSEGLHFYDAVAPIVSLDSVDMEARSAPPGMIRELRIM